MRIRAYWSLLSGVMVFWMPPVGALARDGHGSHDATSIPSSAAATVARPTARLASTSWTQAPIIVPAGRPERGAALLDAINSQATQLRVSSPNTVFPSATLEKHNAGRWEVKSLEPGIGGYHWLSARDVRESEIRTASTAWMFSSKAPSPASMLDAQRSGLVIVPTLLPEHGGYTEGSSWDFKLGFDGVPVADATIRLDTEIGTQLPFVTNKAGIASVTFPRDFTDDMIDKEHGAARTRRGYALSAELERDGVRHVTGFNTFYYADRMRERNLLAGAGLMLLGMVLATPMLRRKKERAHA